jgi:tRNA G18 (ribose-2'-O)-methylase SpoU
VIHRLTSAPEVAGDSRLAAYRHVGDAQWLAANGLFVAEGRLVVERLLALPQYPIESVLVTPAALAALERVLAPAPCAVYVVDRDALATVAGFNFHRGCLAIARRPMPPPLETILAADRVVVLEGVGNPDNVGGIFRTAAALGAGGVVLDPSSGDPLYRKAIRTSMAATLRLPWVRMDEWPADLERVRAAGFRIVALTPDESAVSIDDFATSTRPRDRVALLLGAEGPGVTVAAMALADVRVRIPIDPAFNSLNVAVAAGIALARLRR